MKLDRRLNIVLSLETPSGPIYVHSAPISREVFELYFSVISQTFAAIYSEGHGPISGPRIAALLLKQVATSIPRPTRDEPTRTAWPDVERGLMNEIRRLTNVIMPGPKGWMTIPLEEGLRTNNIDAMDASEVENAIVFFTVCSIMHRKADLPDVLAIMSKLWGAQTTSSNCTEFSASLPTSIADENSGEKVPGSSAIY
jgi:hypothetical protein